MVNTYDSKGPYWTVSLLRQLLDGVPGHFWVYIHGSGMMQSGFVEPGANEPFVVVSAEAPPSAPRSD